MAAAGIVLINILQVYNWADKRFIQLVLIFYFLQQFCGYMTPVNYVPRCQWAAPPIWYWLLGVTMFGLGILDFWLFFFNPLQKNFFVDQEQRTKSTSVIPSRHQSLNFCDSTSLDRAMSTSDLVHDNLPDGRSNSKLVITKSTFTAM